MPVVVKLTPKKEVTVEGGKTAEKIFEELGLGKDIIAAKLNGKLIDLTDIILEGTLEPVSIHSKDGIEILRHSAAHLLAHAVSELYPDAKPTIGPPVEDPPGFYYDIEMPPISSDDLKKIEEKMREISNRNYKIEKMVLKKEELLQMFRDNPFKSELIKEEVEDGGKSTAYKQGNYVEFCTGPHVPSTGYIKGFKLLNISTAFWRGKEDNPKLIRIYGTAFPTKEELEQYLNMVEEAKKRDHRKIGAELDLFIMRPEYGPAFPIYTPKGAIIRNELIDYMRELNAKAGYEEVWTPHAFRTTLWEKSGHMSHYRENMFLMELENEEYGMKPMNCPGHILIFQRKAWSYREMPARYSEFGTVYRYERSGVTNGLLRVRSLTQDDGHAFVRIDQIDQEVGKLIDMIQEVYYKTFGIKELRFKLSTRDENNREKYAGSDEVWAVATTKLKEVLESRGLAYEIKEGEAAFYGPKIDVDVRDAIGRYWQLSTIQLDFFMPDENHFDLKYVDENNQYHHPVMIHRAIYGTLDRFMGIIIEHFAGAFPLWLSPVQVRILTVGENAVPYANQVFGKLKGEGIRVDLDTSTNTISKKIRNAHDEKIPYVLILGEKEVSQNKVSVRDRKMRQKNLVNIEEFIGKVKEEISTRALEISFCETK